MKPHKLNRQNVILLIILLVIILLVVIFAVTHRKNNQSQLTTTQRTTSVTESFTEEFARDDGYSGEYHVKKVGSSYQIYIGNKPYPDTGLRYVKLPGSSQKDYYYFTNGKFDKQHTGVEIPPGDSPLVNHRYVYIKNGRLAKNFTGVVSYEHYMRVFKNGVYQDNYNGEVSLGGLETECEHGAVLGVELGRDDNFVPPYKVTILG